ncbi:hypothetical protein KDH83_12205 [Achromobacter sp. Marseille-Q0513]|uniref:fascin domain-containing protein n=1 Tax=Achromobacter sp. Marseille-Q0513 TaxID=2829161 RepID=UPI001B9E9C9A|nr:hypothetical protein [Achromobacter sp. Marseille-Q0513]MBR8654058.1 hypothetical protein [Achromobacter sp. Marseille-Q0513]
MSITYIAHSALQAADGNYCGVIADSDGRYRLYASFTVPDEWCMFICDTQDADTIALRGVNNLYLSRVYYSKDDPHAIVAAKASVDVYSRFTVTRPDPTDQSLIYLKADDNTYLSVIKDSPDNTPYIRSGKVTPDEWCKFRFQTVAVGVSPST